MFEEFSSTYGLHTAGQDVALPRPTHAGLDRIRVAGRSPGTYLLGVALLAGLYYGSAQLGYDLAFSGAVAAIVWLPVGIGIAFLYFGGLAFWPGVLLGDILTNSYSALPTFSSLAQTVGNVLEVVVATWIIRRLVQRGSPLDSVRGVGCMLLAITAGVALSATIGTFVLVPTHVLTLSTLPGVWRTWWLGDFSGAIVVVPFALAWYRQPLGHLFGRQRLEAGVLLLASVGLTEFAFRVQQPLVFVTIPALVWAALRFGARGATLTLALTVSLVVWHTTHDFGPFAFHSLTESVLVTQLFIAVAALLTLFVAAVAAERERFEAGLAASRVRLVEAADAERRRVERNIHDGSQQRLSALATRIHDTKRRLATPEQAAALLDDTETQLRLALEELRELAHGIHPAVLRDFGLSRALRSLAGRANVRVKLDEVTPARLDDTAEATAYYLVAEAIANAQKHADASVVRVRISLKRRVVEVEVADDGVGGAHATAGSGLEGLADRVEALGGTFELSSPVGGGTRIVAWFPAASVEIPRDE
jgi:signal transduction histidine kinase